MLIKCGKKFKKMPDIERVKECLKFDYETNRFVWIKPNSKSVSKGDVAGCVNAKGYRVIRLDVTTYLEHRLVYYYHYGVDPVDYLIDHKDRDKTNNNPDNLRLADYSLNSSNRDVNTHKVTGYVEPEIKSKLQLIAQLWGCSESKALSRLILENDYQTA